MSEVPEYIAALERTVAEDPAAPGFAALGEWYRRSERLSDAERVLLAGLAEAPDAADARAVLALVLADAGRDTDLRRQLEGWAEAAMARLAESQAVARPSPVLLPGGDEAGEVSASELEQAFARAEPDLDEMITPDTVAEEAALRVDAPFAEDSPFAPLEPGGAFATQTMADLLERQGDHEGAARIRERLDPAREISPEAGIEAMASAEPVPSASTVGVDAMASTESVANADPVVSELERWLGNARRMQTT